MNVLITGISGFVGSNFVLKWKDIFTIFGLDIIKPDREGVKQTFLWNELNELPNVEVIIHLAGKAHDTQNKTEEKTYFDINTGLTQKIVDYFLESKATKLVFFSSVKAVADKVQGKILTEEVIPQPKGAYGESKIKAEQYILSKKDECEKQNKKVYIIRPCMIHGRGNKGNLNMLYKMVQKGIPWFLGSFKNKRSFCAIDNMTFVIENLINKNIESGIYNVCDDEYLSTNELIDLMGKSANKKYRILKISKSIVIGLAKLGNLLRLPLNTHRLDKLTENYVVSNQKIKKALNVKKMPISAQEGMLKTFESFKKKTI